MSHWYTQGRLGAEHRDDLDREAAKEALRSVARASGGERPGIIRSWFASLDRLLGDPMRRLASVRRGVGSARAEPPISTPLPVVPVIPAVRR
jgi:hypothetical protein